MPELMHRMSARRVRLSWIAWIGLALLPWAGSARDLQGRLGLGYNSEFANFQVPNGVPAISLKYGLTRDFAIEGVLGVSTSSPRNSVVGGKFFKNIFFET